MPGNGLRSGHGTHEEHSMNALSTKEIIQLIRAGTTFEAVAADGSFHIKVNKYVPYLCVAPHHGHRFRKELAPKMALDDYQRWYYEAPHTGTFIDSLPITMDGRDSCLEYDLNSPPEACIPKDRDGQSLWKKPLTSREEQQNKNKHRAFYSVLHALVDKLIQQYEGCAVYDIQAFGYKERYPEAPLFRISADPLASTHFTEGMALWRMELAKIRFSNQESPARITQTDQHGGYLSSYLHENFPRVLVLSTAIKKVYCDELSGEDYPELISDLRQSIKEAVLGHAQEYSKRWTSWKTSHSAHLLDRKEDPVLGQVDKRLTKILKGFELLAYVNPTNTAQEKRKFFKSNFTEPPRFRYSPIRISPFELKQELSALPTRDISDISVRNLYEAVIGSYFDKIDLLSSLNSTKFLYNSLRYLGRPEKNDLQNAQYLLHLPPIASEPRTEPNLNSEEVVSLFKTALSEYGMQCRIEFSKKVISQVMVLNSRKTILIRPDARFTRKEVNALIEHEIGVHMVTTQNSLKQPLHIFNAGLPVNTRTQEGLAILSEYLSGNITLKRLKKLALRVVVVDMMCNGADFIDCFQYLIAEQEEDPQDAFTLVTRVFRGGGFTKDYLYLSGFVRILKFWKAGNPLYPLLVGKTSLDFYDTIDEMINRDMLAKPTYHTRSFLQPRHKSLDPIYRYIISGLH